ncbi:MAG: hypothetical protein Q8L60_15750 [Gammaproteobacteria bacterium]|nr:hypothetical protein [Gammaproteobacteria bacterium]MDP2139356.1 hypothetical protein [Gammaproteobacteria bacterium]MDP2347271.1 hypothetical protein [Gammaproteobacteria bacterium]
MNEKTLRALIDAVTATTTAGAIKTRDALEQTPIESQRYWGCGPELS